MLFALPLGALGDITSGAAIAIIATWMGIIGGYLRIRRSILQDREEMVRRVATDIVNAEITRRAATFMDRREQELINDQNTERYRTLTNLTSVAHEMRMMVSALERAIAKDEMRREERDGR